ncbi:hypothetical protein MKW98_028038, partial [Papaver atlanticum]
MLPEKWCSIMIGTKMNWVSALKRDRDEEVEVTTTGVRPLTSVEVSRRLKNRNKALAIKKGFARKLLRVLIRFWIPARQTLMWINMSQKPLYVTRPEKTLAKMDCTLFNDLDRLGKSDIIDNVGTENEQPT